MGIRKEQITEIFDILRNEHKLNPIAIFWVQETDFFNRFNNSFDGYFIRVLFKDNSKRTFFAVPIYKETVWFIEYIEGTLR